MAGRQPIVERPLTPVYRYALIVLALRAPPLRRLHAQARVLLRGPRISEASGAAGRTCSRVASTSWVKLWHPVSPPGRVPQVRRRPAPGDDRPVRLGDRGQPMRDPDPRSQGRRAAGRQVTKLQCPPISTQGGNVSPVDRNRRRPVPLGNAAPGRRRWRRWQLETILAGVLAAALTVGTAWVAASHGGAERATAWPTLLLDLRGATQPAPVASAVRSAPCEFVLGFAALREAIGPETVGECVEDQQFADNGDALQRTTVGLLVWRKGENLTAFTDGATTWLSGPFGIQRRPNDERFAWEAEATSIEPSSPPAARP